MLFKFRYTLFCFTITVLCGGDSKKVSIRIVDKPHNNGAFDLGDNSGPEEKVLTLNVQPAPFSGPPQFRRLVGKCFTYTTDKYKYEFCPFHNFTQHEQSMRWNPYSGVVGVWQQWQITNNTFEAMLMEEGEPCGNITRTVAVHFACGSSNKMVEVKEPRKCTYMTRFETPLVCHPDAMLVYPRLPSNLQQKWDRLETDLVKGLLTNKGYAKQLRIIFEEAGFQMSEMLHAKLKEEAKEKEKQQKLEKFDSLNKCNNEYRRLKQEVEHLKKLLKDNGIQIPNEELNEVKPIEGADYFDDYHMDNFLNDDE